MARLGTAGGVSFTVRLSLNPNPELQFRGVSGDGLMLFVLQVAVWVKVRLGFVSLCPRPEASKPVSLSSWIGALFNFFGII